MPNFNPKKKPSPRPAQIHIEDLMVASVMTTTPSRSAGHVRKIMAEHRIHAMPVVGADGEPLGIVTSTDLIGEDSEATPVSKLMTREVQTVSPYAEPALAARMMRKHAIHHLVVSHEQKVVGILSSFDLLRLVEDRRFVEKNPSTPSRKRKDDAAPDAP